MFERCRLSHRLALLVLVAILGLLALGASSLWWMRSNLDAAEERRIKDVVDTTTAVLDYFYEQEVSGKLSRQAAQNEALALLRKTRFERGLNYVFINDANGAVLLSPLRPDTEGTVMLGRKTADGVLLWDELTETIRQGEARLITYMWPRSAGAEPERKYSWVRPYAPWGWAVGAGIYLTAVDDAYRTGLAWTLAICGLLLALIAALSWRVTRSVLGQLGGDPGGAAEVMQRVADGDMSADVGYASSGSLLHALGVMLGSMRAILNAWRVATIGMDEQGLITDWGRPAETLFGWTRAEAIGRSIDDFLILPPHRETYRRGLLAFLETGNDGLMNRRLEMTAAHCSGKAFSIELVITPRKNRDTYRFAAYVTDDSERKAAAESLLTLSRAIEQSPVSIVITDPKGKIHYVNPKFEATSGYGRSEVAGRDMAFLRADNEHALSGSSDEMWETILAGKVWQGEFHTQRKDGSLFWELVVISPVYNEQNELIHFVLVKEDITERKATLVSLMEARETAERANQAKSDFLSSMSHELRTPMNAILGFAQMLEYDADLNADQQDNVHEILKGGRHLLQLINEVLDLAKIESGRIDLSLEPLDLNELVESCLDLIQPLAAARNISLQLDVPPLSTVRGDRIRLKQALLNLLSNAVKYNSEGGAIALGVESATDQRLRIKVSDSGAGISPENLQEIFEPFSRLKAEHSEIEGTGIGLSITRQLVELMGGNVGLESTVGVGSTFWIELPSESPRIASDADSSLPLSGNFVQPICDHRVLCIDDNPVNLKLVAQMIGLRSHIHLLTAHSPGLGIELALTQHPDLILLDINMPNMDGYQVLEILKSNVLLKDVPVVAITANAMPRDIERGRAAGFAEYLTKPLHLGQFLQAVDRFLDSSGKGAT